MRYFCFVGERKSNLARVNGWSWKDGRLAAKQLFDALAFCNISQEMCTYENIFVPSKDRISYAAVRRIYVLARAGYILVAMGEKVDATFTTIGFRHRVIPHPATRGWMRKKLVYNTIVRYVLRGDE